MVKHKKHSKPAGPSSKAKNPGGVLTDGRVVLNEANEEQLCQLPGVGPSRAKQIVALRKRLKGYRSLRQLTRVRGIGYRTVRKLAKHLVLNTPQKGAGRE